MERQMCYRNTMLVCDFVKLLQSEGAKVKKLPFYRRLREKGWLDSQNCPTAWAKAQGYVVGVWHSVMMYGEIRRVMISRLTEKGMDLLRQEGGWYEKDA